MKPSVMQKRHDALAPVEPMHPVTAGLHSLLAKVILFVLFVLLPVCGVVWLGRGL